MKKLQPRSAVALVLAAVLLPVSVIVPAKAEMVMQTLTAPKEVMAKYPYPFTGTLAKAFTSASTVSGLTVSPDTGILDTPFTVCGS